MELIRETLVSLTPRQHLIRPCMQVACQLSFKHNHEVNLRLNPGNWVQAGAIFLLRLDGG